VGDGVVRSSRSSRSSRSGEGGSGAGFDYPDDGDGDGLLDVFEGQGGGGVAGYDEEVGALFVEKLCAGDGVAGDGFAGFGAVGQARSVAEVDVVGAWDEGEQRAEDGEAAEAGVEDADGGGFCRVRFLGHGCGESGVSVGGVGLAVVSVAG